MKKMNKICKKIKLIQGMTIVEYAIVIYTILTAIINSLNFAEIINFNTWFMKPTFLGPSLLILLLVQYSLISVNRQDQILVKIRPYIMGILTVGIISTCYIPLILMLILFAGYCLTSGYEKQYTAAESWLTILTACAGMEIYSIIMLIQGVTISGSVGRFLSSIWVDVLFVLVVVAFGIVTRDSHAKEEDECQDIDDHENPVEKRRRFSKQIKFLTMLKRNSQRIVRCIGVIFCTVSLGLFIFCFVISRIGVSRIAASSEEMYLLKNCEDTSLVLAVEEEKDTENYNVSFQKYKGMNNQKVQLVDTDDGFCQMVFVEPKCALEVEMSEDNNVIAVYAAPMTDADTQKWSKVIWDKANAIYGYFSIYDIPLCYSMLDASNGKPIVSAQVGSGDYEIFTVEKTVSDEVITRIMSECYEAFTPTILIETVYILMGGWICVIFVLIVLALGVIWCCRRVLGDELAMVSAILFIYLLAYGAVSAILLFVCAFGLQCYCGYCKKCDEDRKRPLRKC